jgi:hypothetical protein
MNLQSVMLFAAQSLLLVVLICFVSNLPAVEQFQLNQCLQLQSELEKTRRKQRNGYRLREAETLRENEHRLQKQLFFHCEKPVVMQSARNQNARNFTSQDKSPTRRLLPSSRLQPFERAHSVAAEFLTSAVEIKAPYQGQQLMAWLGYYQEPRFCYGVRTTSVIVECAARRQQAMQQFEREWQQKPSNLSDQP